VCHLWGFSRMKCSKCKLQGYNKNNCPACKEKAEKRLNQLLEILPTQTVFVALTYFVLSQELQKLGTGADILGTGGDLTALKSPDPGIFLGGMASLIYETKKEDKLSWVDDLFKFVEAGTGKGQGLVGPVF